MVGGQIRTKGDSLTILATLVDSHFINTSKITHLLSKKKYFGKVVLGRFHSSAPFGWAMSQKNESCENVYLVNCKLHNCIK